MPPTGKHCRRERVQDERDDDPLQQILDRLGGIQTRMDQMDRRIDDVVERRSETNSDIAGEDIQPVGEVEEATGNDETSGEEATPKSLRRDITLMAEAANRIAQLRMEEFEEREDGNVVTVRRATGKKSGSTLMASDVVEQTIDWPHLHVRRMIAGRSKSIAYADLRVEEFVAGFLSMIEAPKCKWDYKTMITILRAVMQDTINYSWTNALGFYENLGIAVEMGEMAWSDKEAIRDKRLAYPRTGGPEKKETKEITAAAPKPKPQLSRCCAPYQNNTCQQQRDHPPFMHACAYCFKTVAAVYKHTESTCARKTSDEAKNDQRRE